MSYYQHHLFFCTNQRNDGRACCQDHDATAARAYAKRRCKELGIAGAGKVRVNTAGCLDRCESGPVLVIYPQETWYTWMDEEDIEEILQRHVLKGEVVERLLIDGPDTLG